MTPEDFLADKQRRSLSLDGARLTPVAAFDGRGNHALEVVLATAANRMRGDDLRRAWKARHGSAPNPLLLVAAYEVDGVWKASICGPLGEEPPVEADLDLSLVERIATAALDRPSRHQAIRFLGGILAEVESELPGIRNHGMLATHELRDGVPQRSDWPAECERARTLLSSHGRELVEKLGFTIDQHSTATTVLSIGDARRAIAVFLEETEEFEAPSARFDGTSPVTHALAYADRAELPWVVATRGAQIRLYSAKPDVGVGRKGRADTYVEANLALVPDDQAGYVTLLFSADALKTGGTLTEILETSRDYAAGLGARLRDRVYVEGVPTLALALAKRHPGDLDETALEAIYEQALTVLFRLLFVAYAEDKDLLPYRSNGAYRDHALKTRARELAERRAAGSLVFDENATDLWTEVAGLWTAIDKGNVERGVPPYNGGLFSTDPDVNAAGAALADLTLKNAEFGPALVALLVDEGEDDVVGPVDFRSLSVREFGTIYEGLLESSLSIAPSDLTLDAKRSYVPARDREEVVVEAGTVYFHNRSGARKSSGTYFTKPFAVEHLLDHALEPALDDHLARIQELVDAGEDAKAADAFFDFRCVDLAMGSGHFLVAAVDRIESRLSGFLALHPISHVTAELDRLRAAAYEALGPLGEGVEIEHASLLRRQVARRCIYGIDLNPVAVELARLGIWIYTFVPGLPLSFLDRTLVSGDSLTGIGTLDDAIQALDPEQLPGQPSLFRDEILAVLGRAESALRRLARTSDASAAEIADAREAHAEALEAVQPASDLFDLIVAARLGAAKLLTRYDEASLAVNPDLPEARKLVRDIRSLHAPVAFPEVFVREPPGFDCILGNPPWDKVRFEAQQFWVGRAPGLNALSAGERERAIERLRAERPDDCASEKKQRAERERLQGMVERAYVHQGGGHHEFAKLFAERALALLAPCGTLGYVLPRQWAVLRGWEPLRKKLIGGHVTSVAQLRNAGGWLFDDVHNSYMITLMTRTTAEERRGRVLIWGGATTPEELAGLRDETALELSEREVAEASEGWGLPWMNTLDDRAVFEQMRRQPRLGSRDSWIQAEGDSSWDFSGSGRHRKFAVASSDEGAWRVLMTRHVIPFGINEAEPFNRFVSHPEMLAPLGRGVELEHGRPHLSVEHPLIVFRYPSRNDDSRTIIATALPESGFLFSKGYVHALVHPRGTSIDHMLALLAYLNSLIADWWARRFVDRHITNQIFTSLPLPAWEHEQIRVAGFLAAELLARNGIDSLPGGTKVVRDPTLSTVRDVEIKASIERLAQAGFELNNDGLATILADFSPSGCPDELRLALASP